MHSRTQGQPVTICPQINGEEELQHLCVKTPRLDPWRWILSIHELTDGFSFINQWMCFDRPERMYRRIKAYVYDDHDFNPCSHKTAGVPPTATPCFHSWVASNLLIFSCLLSHIVILFSWRQIGPGHQWLLRSHLWRPVGFQLPSGKGDGVSRFQECRILTLEGNRQFQICFVAFLRLHASDYLPKWSCSARASQS